MTDVSHVQKPYDTWLPLYVSLEYLANIKGRQQKQRSPKGYTDCYRAVWVQAGRFSQKTDFQEISAQGGEWIFSQPGSYSRKRESNTPTIEVAFYFRWTGKGFLSMPFKQPHWKFPSNIHLEQQTLKLHTLVQSTFGSSDASMRQKGIDLSAHFTIRSHFHLWFMILIQSLREQKMDWFHVQDKDERIVRAIRYITQSPLNHPFRIEELMKETNMSESSLRTLFQRECGMPPKRYWLQFKLKIALEDLQNNKQTIEAIATRLGKSRPWFHAWIKQETGMTPSEIRNGKTHI